MFFEIFVICHIHFISADRINAIFFLFQVPIEIGLPMQILFILSVKNILFKDSPVPMEGLFVL